MAETAPISVKPALRAVTFYPELPTTADAAPPLFSSLEPRDDVSPDQWTQELEKSVKNQPAIRLALSYFVTHFLRYASAALPDNYLTAPDGPLQQGDVAEWRRMARELVEQSELRIRSMHDRVVVQLFAQLRETLFADSGLKLYRLIYLLSFWRQHRDKIKETLPPIVDAYAHPTWYHATPARIAPVVTSKLLEQVNATSEPARVKLVQQLDTWKTSVDSAGKRLANFYVLHNALMTGQTTSTLSATEINERDVIAGAGQRILEFLSLEHLLEMEPEQLDHEYQRLQHYLQSGSVPGSYRRRDGSVVSYAQPNFYVDAIAAMTTKDFELDPVAISVPNRPSNKLATHLTKIWNLYHGAAVGAQHAQSTAILYEIAERMKLWSGALAGQPALRLIQPDEFEKLLVAFVQNKDAAHASTMAAVLKELAGVVLPEKETTTAAAKNQALAKYSDAKELKSRLEQLVQDGTNHASMMEQLASVVMFTDATTAAKRNDYLKTLSTPDGLKARLEQLMREGITCLSTGTELHKKYLELGNEKTTLSTELAAAKVQLVECQRKLLEAETARDAAVSTLDQIKTVLNDDDNALKELGEYIRGTSRTRKPPAEVDNAMGPGVVSLFRLVDPPLAPHESQLPPAWAARKNAAQYGPVAQVLWLAWNERQRRAAPDPVPLPVPAAAEDSRLADLRTKLAQTTDELRECRTALDKAKADLDTCREALKTNTEQAVEQHAGWTVCADELTAARVETETAKERLRVETERLRRASEKMFQEHNADQDRIAKLEHDLSVVDQELTDCRQKLSDQQDELKACRKSLKAIQVRPPTPPTTKNEPSTPTKRPRTPSSSAAPSPAPSDGEQSETEGASNQLANTSLNPPPQTPPPPDKAARPLDSPEPGALGESGDESATTKKSKVAKVLFPPIANSGTTGGSLVKVHPEGPVPGQHTLHHVPGGVPLVAPAPQQPPAPPTLAAAPKTPPPKNKSDNNKIKPGSGISKDKSTKDKGTKSPTAKLPPTPKKNKPAKSSLDEGFSSSSSSNDESDAPSVPMRTDPEEGLY
jgi:predicted  nucleic acid-binding Zn-ribbon protein